MSFYYIYNLGKYRLKRSNSVYYMLWGFIPIFLFDIDNPYDVEEGWAHRQYALTIFHQIVAGKLKSNTHAKDEEWWAK